MKMKKERRSPERKKGIKDIKFGSLGMGAIATAPGKN